jgi:5-methylcytosine-specific restriction protein B
MVQVWKIAPGGNAWFWEESHKRGCITINWLNKVSLAGFKSKEDVKQALKRAGDKTGGATSIWPFVKEIRPGHIVVANDGLSRVVGIGVVRSGYIPPDDPRNPTKDREDNRHAYLVDWSIDKPVESGRKPFFTVQHTVWPLKSEQCESIKRAYLKKYPELRKTLEELFATGDPPPDQGLEAENMRALLKHFRQVIVYGPPGTGKTREAKRVALALLSGTEARAQETEAEEEIERKLRRFRDENRFDLVVFHPAYEYEQFVGGIEPSETGGQLAFHTKPGVFLRLCRAAETHRKPAILLIDEINRGNLPKLLGELVYALEYRNSEVKLPFEWGGRTSLTVPDNLYIIATMNSADRSIGHIDVAIRRRFGLYHLAPNPAVIRGVWEKARDESYGEDLARLMGRLNDKLANGNDPSAEAELGVGHSYFLPVPGSSGELAKEQVQMKWDYQVQPLLREYAQLLNLGSDFHAFLKKPLTQALAEP